ncbi:MAG: hypothetical protein U0P45_15785 [Acidimicrobiales bacterium]
MDLHPRTTITLAGVAALLVGIGALAVAPATAQDLGPTTTEGSSTTVSVPTTPTVTAVETTVTGGGDLPLGPVQPLDLTYDAAARQITIVNPCPTGGDDDSQQVTYDLFLVSSTGESTQLATKDSPYATVPAGQSATYPLPASTAPGSYEVLLQCSALPITIEVPREQFSTTIEVEAAATTAEPTPATPVGGAASYTG